MCPICDSNHYKMTGHVQVGHKASKVISKDYEVVRCLNCQTYYVEPLISLTLSDWRFLYDEQYFVPMSNWYYKNRKRDRKSRFDKLVSFVNRPVENFLDVGCGEGYCLIEAVQRGWKAFGTDISDNRISDAKLDCIEFTNGTLTEIGYPNNFFDIIYMDSVLEHVINPGQYLSEINRILKKGGLVYIGVPNEDSLLNDVKKIFYMLVSKNYSSKLKPFETPYHVVGFNKNSLTYALIRNGFTIRKLRNFACRVEFMKAKFPTKYFFHSFALLPIYLLAIPFRKEVYLEAYVQK